MNTAVDDRIDVVVSFEGNRVIPRRLRWNRRDYDIARVNLVHMAREGEKRVFYFSVSDFANYFKLRFDAETLEWRLVEIYAD